MSDNSTPKDEIKRKRKPLTERQRELHRESNRRWKEKHRKPDGRRRPLTAEHKAKISAATKGKPFTESHKAAVVAACKRRKGTKASDETRAKQSAARRKLISIPCGCGCAQMTSRGKRFIKGHYTKLQWQQRSEVDIKAMTDKTAGKLRGRPATEQQLKSLAIGWGLMSGSNHWNWKGGVERVYPNEYRRLRPLILERDGYRCVKCLAETSLVVHHIDNDKKHNCFLNLVTLCDGCNHKAEARVNKGPWSVELRLYTESISIERHECQRLNTTQHTPDFS